MSTAFKAVPAHDAISQGRTSRLRCGLLRAQGFKAAPWAPHSKMGVSRPEFADARRSVVGKALPDVAKRCFEALPYLPGERPHAEHAWPLWTLLRVRLP
jgi:hypothetical protein